MSAQWSIHWWFRWNSGQRHIGFNNSFVCFNSNIIQSTFWLSMKTQSEREEKSMRSKGKCETLPYELFIFEKCLNRDRWHKVKRNEVYIVIQSVCALRVTEIESCDVVVNGKWLNPFVLNNRTLSASSMSSLKKSTEKRNTTTSQMQTQKGKKREKNVNSLFVSVASRFHSWQQRISSVCISLEFYSFAFASTSSLQRTIFTWQSESENERSERTRTI